MVVEALIVTAAVAFAAVAKSAVVFAVKPRIAQGLKKLDPWNPL